MEGSLQTACFYWPAIVILCSLFITYADTVAVTTSCPISCQCSPNATIVCEDIDIKSWREICNYINNHSSKWNVLPKLYLKGLLLNAVSSFDCLPPVQSLFVSNVQTGVLPLAIKNLEIRQSLSLTHNGIIDLPDNIFLTFETVVSLNLSFNSISELHQHAFSGLFALQSLDLSFNNISVIGPSSFHVLSNLTYLNLRHNRIQHLTVWHLPLSTNLQALVLRENEITSFYIGDNSSDSTPVDNVKSLDISQNPLECSCTLQKFLHKVYSQGGSIVNGEHSLCHSPSPVVNMSITHLNETALSCTEPHSLISFPSESKAVLYRSSITLECRAEAFPSPHIMWITPWGDKFSLAPLQLIVHKGLALEDGVHTHREYEDEVVMLASSIKLAQNNDLIISHFRGSLTGDYSCIAFNEVGKTEEVIHLSVYSMIKSTYHTSLKFASYTASVCLLVGFIIGLITICVRKLGHKHFFKVPFFTPAASVHPVEERPPSILSDLSPPTSPLLECISEEGMDFQEGFDWRESPEKRPPIHILDSIEGAKGRLRDGMGRKMESMRKNVQSIKESTGAYVHTIMESGSSAAHKMKAGVAIGVETVKSHVQSVKELCGTGNMGTHTISIISMETNIDTNQQKSVVKQVTFV